MAAGQESGLDGHDPERSARLVRREVQRRADEDVPERADRRLRLAETEHEECAERLLVTRTRIDAAEAKERSKHAKPVRRKEVRVTQNRECARSNDCRASELVDHRQRETRAPQRSRLIDVPQEAEVLGEAAKRDVLTVVRRRPRITLALGECLDRAAQGRPSFEERDFVTRFQELERSRAAGEPTPDDHGLHRRRPSPTIRSFVSADRCGGPSKMSKPAASIRSSVAR